MRAIQPKIRIISDPLASISSPLLFPHYSDERFLEAQTIFLKKGFKAPVGFCGIEQVKGALYRYSDRLLQGFSSEKTDKAWEAARNSGYDHYTAAYREVYLQSLFENKSLQIVHILSQLRQDNGYSLRIYGFLLPDAVRPASNA